MALLGLDNSIKNLIINKDKNHCSCKVSLSEEMVDAIQNYECLSIGLSNGQWPDLSFLERLSPPLQRLRTQSEDVDWSSIINLSDLKELVINGVVKESIDFTKLKNLKSLEYSWDKKNAESVFLHEGIEYLIVYGVKAKDFSVFERMSSLKKLEVRRGNFTKLDGVDRLKNLKSLRLNNMTKLEDVSALNKLDGLLHLAIGSCNKFCFPKDISGLQSIRELSLLKQKNVDSLSFVSKLPKIEVLKVFETIVKDGDLKFLQNLSSLQALRMDARRSYSFDIDAFSQALKDKYGDYEIDVDEAIKLKM